MAYTALYRKWRPQTFGDVQGQDHIVTTIRNQVAAGRVSHAYLFCGTRGTGKTTVAKILAKAVNCEHPVDGEPCGHCRSCRSIDEGNSMNVLEIDAASNNGVDYIRRIREEVQYAPTEGRYRVYIIDEAHMLTNNAFNAFLKTLEEPPEYVIFIFATTEANKILQTVESRCQRYDFHRIDSSVIAARLAQMTQAEGIRIDERALRFLAAKGEGSMRDAISLLDKCAAACFDGEITYDRVLDLLGVSDTENCSRVFRALCVGQIGEAVLAAHAAFEKGVDAANFVSDMIRYMRALMLLQSSAGSEDVLEMSRENIERLKKDAALAGPVTVLRFLRILSELYGQLRASTQRITVVETALVRMARPETEADTEALIQRTEMLGQRIAELERRIAELEAGASAAPAVMQAAPAPPVPAMPEPEPEWSVPAPAMPKPEPEEAAPEPGPAFAEESPAYEPSAFDPAPALSEEPPFDIPYEEIYGPAELFGEEAFAEPAPGPAFQAGPEPAPEPAFRPAPEPERPASRRFEPEPAPEPRQAAPAAAGAFPDIMSHWDEIVSTVGGAAFLYLKNATVELTAEDEGVVRFADRNDYEFGASERNLELIQAAAEQIVGRKIRFTAVVGGGGSRDAGTPEPAQQEDPLSHDDIQKLFGMNVESE